MALFVCMYVFMLVQEYVNDNWDFFRTSLKSHYDASATLEVQIAQAVTYLKSLLKYIVYVCVLWFTIANLLRKLHAGVCMYRGVPKLWTH